MNENKTEKVKKASKIKAWWERNKGDIIETVGWGLLGGICVSVGHYLGYKVGHKDGVLDGLKAGSHLGNVKDLMNVHSAWNNSLDEIIEEPCVITYIDRMGFKPEDIRSGSVVVNFELTPDGLKKVNDITYSNNVNV